VEALLCRFTHAIIAVSPQVAEDLIAHGVAPRSNVHVVSLGFDLAYLRDLERTTPPTLRSQLGIPKEAVVIGIVGRLVPVKGIDRFLQALCPLLRENPNLHLTVLGDGPERKKLTELAHSLASADEAKRIHFPGWILPLFPHYRDLDLCVCSSHNEGTSVAIIEAVLAQVPVVSTRVGGMVDLLEDGKWGGLVPSTVDAIHEAVKSWLLIRDPMGQASRSEAREAFEKKFNMERLTLEIRDLYLSLLQARHQS